MYCVSQQFENAALDGVKPLAHRASHVRSCVNHVANRIGWTRIAVMDRILAVTGVDLNALESEDDLIRAFKVLEGLEAGSADVEA